MSELIGHLDFHLPGHWVEVVILLCAVALLLSLWRVASAGFALAGTGIALLGYIFVGDISIPLFLGGVAVGLHLYSRTGRTLDASTPALLTQILLVGAGYLAYEVSRVFTEGSFEDALRNATSIINFERNIGLLIERDIQDLVMPHEHVLRAFNTTYSFFFLATVLAALLWLFPVDRKNFIVLRNGLGVSAALAAVTFAVFPVAPPRLVPDVAILDTVVVLGREHDFVNEFAAVPSLHVGWMAVVGYAMARHIGGWRGAMVGVLPGSVMGVTVVITGNHYWIDGAIGGVYALVPAWLTAHPGWVRARVRTAAGAAHAVNHHVTHGAAVLWATWRGRFTLFGLTGLLSYLVVGDILYPGFTDYWGYLVLQMAVTLILLAAGEVVFEKQGGLSWVTHVIAVSTGYADVLGTAGDLYSRIDEYDKLTHFFGTAAVTAGVYDCLRGLHRRGYTSWWAVERAMAAPLLGIAAGVGWEVWELIGDKVLNTSRIGGWWDTANDLVSDAAGAVFIVVLLRAAERSHAPPPVEATEPEPASPS